MGKVTRADSKLGGLRTKGNKGEGGKSPVGRCAGAAGSVNPGSGCRPEGLRGQLTHSEGCIP